MNPTRIPSYKELIKNYSESLEKLNKQHLNISLLRLALFLSTALSWFWVFTQWPWLGASLGTASIIGFLIALKIHKRVEDKRKHTQTLLDINQKEKLCCEGNYASFEDGNEFTDYLHPYSYDIDLFGSGSFFQYLNRTTTFLGKQHLAKWLRETPLSKNQIYNNQEATKELSSLLSFRQEFQAIGKLFQSNDNEQQLVDNWLNHESFFKKHSFIKLLLILLPLFTLTVLGFVISGTLSFGTLLWVLIFNLLVVGSKLKPFNQYYNQLSKSHLVFKKLNHLMALVEKTNFKSPVLNTLKQQLYNENKGASLQVKTLTKLLDGLDNRNNIIVGVVLNALLLWDWQYLLRIEKWRKSHQLSFSTWLETLAEFDALISLANLAYNNPDFNYPQMSKKDFELNAMDLGHPLLSVESRVCNNFDLNKSQRFGIITGANMAGKSTFLRTIATNLILAGCGAPVCASKFEFTPLPLHSSMRAEDSLVKNESYFFAELKRLQSITKALDKGEPLFIVLDEILRGTNSEDKRKGSIGFVKKITQKAAHGLVATHDLELARLAENQPQIFKAMCFEVEFEQNELKFSYKLQKGITQNMNASFLMRKMGIIDAEDKTNE